MKIVVAARCRNDEQHIERFLHGYDFADAIVISDGGSTDRSVQLLQQNSKVLLTHFDKVKKVGGVEFNEDAPHMNFVIDKAKELEPDWLIFDDIDCCPNYFLRENARYIFHKVDRPQINVFRLYMWNDNQFFPKMNNYFDLGYTSLWAWKPSDVGIYAEGKLIESKKSHVSMEGLYLDPYRIIPPHCLLHYSWNEETIDKKLERYKAMGIETSHPLNFAGKPAELPEWARP